MSYIKQTWQAGDEITSAKLNNIETGVSHAEEYVDRIHNAINDLEVGSLSAVGATVNDIPIADGNGSWTWT